jgi:hypothetical protein
MVFCVHTFPKFFPYIHLYIVIKKGFALKKKKLNHIAFLPFISTEMGFTKVHLAQ